MTGGCALKTNKKTTNLFSRSYGKNVMLQNSESRKRNTDDRVAAISENATPEPIISKKNNLKKRKSRIVDTGETTKTIFLFSFVLKQSHHPFAQVKSTSTSKQVYPMSCTQRKLSCPILITEYYRTSSRNKSIVLIQNNVSKELPVSVIEPLSTSDNRNNKRFDHQLAS